MTSHHLVVITVTVTVIRSHRYAGFCLAAMLMEVNSIFLHVRVLLQYCDKRRHPVFKWRVLNKLTVAGYVVFVNFISFVYPL